MVSSGCPGKHLQRENWWEVTGKDREGQKRDAHSSPAPAAWQLGARKHRPLQHGALDVEMHSTRARTPPVQSRRGRAVALAGSCRLTIVFPARISFSKLPGHRGSLGESQNL